MKPTILVVEDYPDILSEIKFLLEFSDFTPITAENGNEALSILSKMDTPPDIIISDIMMPEMDGYEFFKQVSKIPQWSQIPFIFLTAKASPDDIRLGKMLGVDDYLIKPFQKDDLIATISGRLLRKSKIKAINEELKGMIQKLDDNSILAMEKTEEIIIFLVEWDEIVGPVMRNQYPEKSKHSFSVSDLGIQLFQSTVSIYGYKDYGEAEGLLLKIKNINKDGYIYFDSFYDKDVRGEQRQFMLAVISPQITYFMSLKLKKIFKKVASRIKKQEDWKIIDCWSKVTAIFTSLES